MKTFLAPNSEFKCSYCKKRAIMLIKTRVWLHCEIEAYLCQRCYDEIADDGDKLADEKGEE